MSQGDQLHLYNTASRALATARRRGDPRQVDYWSGKPVESIEVLPYVRFELYSLLSLIVSRLPLVRLPIEKPVSLLSQQQDVVNPILVGMTDPFLYNPRRSMAGQVHIQRNRCTTFD